MVAEHPGRPTEVRLGEIRHQGRTFSFNRGAGDVKHAISHRCDRVRAGGRVLLGDAVMAVPLDQGALTQEVMNLKDGHAELRKEFRILDSKMDNGFALLSQKLDTRSKIDWAPISILVGFLLSIGGALYWPVREAQSKTEAQIENMRREDEARVVKLWDEHNRIARDLAYLRGQMHPLAKP
ncbi:MULTISPECIES: hypothetical protein [unclassified Bradyrhizobium]|uniref:hypothetical protein n=1 Tax=unclassified Bradyrhizobium TaxID=2631580 RepID=UPI002916B2F7|nr:MULTISPECIES: hypothetical protein [unclassified Bradyrhizobium]